MVAGDDWSIQLKWVLNKDTFTNADGVELDWNKVNYFSVGYTGGSFNIVTPNSGTGNGNTWEFISSQIGNGGIPDVNNITLFDTTHTQIGSKSENNWGYVTCEPPTTQAIIEGFNNTNVNGGLEQYDILLKRYKKLYQLELKQLLDYKDITVKIPIKPLTMKLTLTSQWTDEQFKNAIATAVTPKVNPSQIIIISNNTPGIIEFTVMQKN